ncbi:hypothetical protein EMIHUDRAFT_205290 [Emiliania huxleyi CCMP1516]|uniref:DNA methylase N-4/N-6 domain-containing protein n=2 Tax=Emiliania huxleyi TaxID=2903 RepID=A0A0D3JUT5_EMIH1|nr:hypothetical protein EMIHUDRAFT_205290 [Emiliania huxleyi CCMP1516]EOD27270.1 hypothetical protein EMIHUDRAFT_205290 [Emiliania huxleyi CCMP1516]|eukprot:XP_005779699.1 hypothetical protein EMIHUDRAFT_205290 [Emiliania huxleyi CCMP1516]
MEPFHTEHLLLEPYAKLPRRDLDVANGYSTPGVALPTTIGAIATAVPIPAFAPGLAAGDAGGRGSGRAAAVAARRMAALASGSVDLVIADPPYNIGVQGEGWDQLGVQGEGWDQLDDYMRWSRLWLRECVRVLRPGGALFLYGLAFVQHISWVYKQGGDSRLKGMLAYSEWFTKPGGQHTFNPHEAVEHYTPEEFDEALAKGVGRVTPESLARGRPPKNWWDIPRENSRSKERRYGAHPSMKPLQICERIVKVHSDAGGCVLVPFGGSGSEVVAAARLGRHCIGFEVEPQYHRLILRRLVGHGLLPAEALPPPYQSGFLGVYKHGKTFVAKVMRDGALRSLGAFQSAESAAAAYAAAVGEAPATSLAAQMAEQQQQQVAEEQVAEQQVAAAATAIAPDPAPLDGVGPAAVPPCGA